MSTGAIRAPITRACSVSEGRPATRPATFGDEPGLLDGTQVLAMSVSGMLAMKEQFPHLRNGSPWRQKDLGDIEVLRGLAAGRESDGGTRAT